MESIIFFVYIPFSVFLVNITFQIKIPAILSKINLFDNYNEIPIIIITTKYKNKKSNI
jgi:hypothetical protein